jgi:hypothetical protein
MHSINTIAPKSDKSHKTTKNYVYDITLRRIISRIVAAKMVCGAEPAIGQRRGDIGGRAFPAALRRAIQ